MAQKKIDPAIYKIIKEYRKKLEKRPMTVEEIILFGSHAKGQAKSYSDIDVAIISNDIKNDAIDEYVELRMIASPIDKRIEPHPFKPKDFNPTIDPLASEIQKTGIRI